MHSSASVVRRRPLLLVRVEDGSLRAAKEDEILRAAARIRRRREREKRRKMGSGAVYLKRKGDSDPLDGPFYDDSSNDGLGG